MGTANTLEADDLNASRAANGDVTAAEVGEGDFDNAIVAGLAGTIDKLALQAKLTPSDTAELTFEPLDQQGNLVLYLPNSHQKALLIGFDETDGNEYIDLSISTAGIAGIPARVLYEYSLGDFGVAASYSQTGANEAYSLAGAYTTGGLKLSTGIAKAKWDDAIKATITAYGITATEAANGRPIYAKASATTAHDLEADDVNLGASYTIGDITLAGVAQRREFSINGAVVDQIDSHGLSVAHAANGLGATAFMMNTDSSVTGATNVYGLGASYDLGGGASVNGGVVGGDVDTVYDVGLASTF